MGTKKKLHTTSDVVWHSNWHVKLYVLVSKSPVQHFGPQSASESIHLQRQHTGALLRPASTHTWDHKDTMGATAGLDKRQSYSGILCILANLYHSLSANNFVDHPRNVQENGRMPLHYTSSHSARPTQLHERLVARNSAYLTPLPS